MALVSSRVAGRVGVTVGILLVAVVFLSTTPHSPVGTSAEGLRETTPEALRARIDRILHAPSVERRAMMTQLPRWPPDALEGGGVRWKAIGERLHVEAPPDHGTTGPFVVWGHARIAERIAHAYSTTADAFVVDMLPSSGASAQKDSAKPLPNLVSCPALSIDDAATAMDGNLLYVQASIFPNADALANANPLLLATIILSSSITLIEIPSPHERTPFALALAPKGRQYDSLSPAERFSRFLAKTLPKPNLVKIESIADITLKSSHCDSLSDTTQLCQRTLLLLRHNTMGWVKAAHFPLAENSLTLLSLLKCPPLENHLPPFLGCDQLAHRKSIKKLGNGVVKEISFVDIGGHTIALAKSRHSINRFFRNSIYQMKRFFSSGKIYPLIGYCEKSGEFASKVLTVNSLMRSHIERLFLGSDGTDMSGKTELSAKQPEVDFSLLEARWKMRKRIAEKLIETTEYFHRFSIVFCDNSAKNFAVDSNLEVLYADLDDLETVNPATDSFTSCGPSQNHKSHSYYQADGKYSFPYDIWKVGSILKNDLWFNDVPPKLTEQTNRIIEMCMNRDHTLRPTADQVLKMIRDLPES